MKKQLYSFIFVSVLSLSTYSQNVFQKAFQRNFSQAYGGVQISDGSYIMAGLYQVSATDYNYLAVKINTNQDTIWAKTYGGIGDEECYAMRPTNDGGFILAGIDSSSGLGSYNVYLVKLNANGDTLWTKSYGGASDDFGQAVQQTSDGGYIVAGYSGSFTTDGNNDVYLLKTDASGNLLWSKTYGGAYGDYAWSVQQTSDGGYIAAGFTSSFGTSPYGNINDIFVMKTDANGNLVWSKTYGQAGDDWAYSIINTNDGGYALTGHTTIDSTGSTSDVFIIKLDVNGDTLWTKSYGGSNYDKGTSIIQQDSDSSFVIGGSTYSYGFGASDALLLKTDKNGNEIFSKTYGQNGNDYAYSLSSCSDLGFALYGYTDNFGVSNESFYIVKTSWTGLSGCSQTTCTVALNPAQINVNTVTPTVSTPATLTMQNTFTIVGDSLSPVFICGAVYDINQIAIQKQQLVIYPNPAGSTLNIINSSNESFQELKIYDVLGNEVLTSNSTQINISNLNSGVYFVRVGNNVQKFIKE